MATIKAIEAKSVHQIQSGQVIVDLCSVVKELVENSLDAGATTIEVRFKNNGLDSIEVQDNGSGISPTNYANVALKHYTSKLSSYADLSSLDTFGFRGEALSSLCALSNFAVTTAQATEAPKGTRLEFDTMGTLKAQSTVACQKGTIASVEDLFNTLPVRRKELAKNIKREYGKVVGLLNAYACIGVGVKFTVKNTMPKGKSLVVFSTKANPSTRDNIANVYGAKTLTALVALELDLDLQPTLTQMTGDSAHTTNVIVRGHISKPVFGEGRQTPDRQMFFVNGRPCGLPQIAKAINEVYKSFNVSQSPFVFADLRMDTNAYDVNVCPDKRTILLHNAADLIERIKARLTELFDNHEQTVPQNQFQTPKLPAFRQLSVQRQVSTPSEPEDSRPPSALSNKSKQDKDANLNERNDVDSDADSTVRRAFTDHFRNRASTREEIDHADDGKRQARAGKEQRRRIEKAVKAAAEHAERSNGVDEYDDVREVQHEPVPESPSSEEGMFVNDEPTAARDSNAGVAEQQDGTGPSEEADEAPISSIVPPTKADPPGAVQDAFDRMRPKRTQAELATITIGDEITTKVIGTQMPKSVLRKKPEPKHKGGIPVPRESESSLSIFSQRLQRFGASGMSAVIRESSAAVNTPDEGPSEADDTDMDGDSQHPDEQENADSDTHADSPDAEDVDDTSQLDPDYVDEEAKKAEEDARVDELIKAAEETMSKVNSQRANKALKGALSKDSTTALMTHVDAPVSELEAQARLLQAIDYGVDDSESPETAAVADEEQESRLSLTVSKADFAGMEIVGQFNLGFIIAVRRASEDRQNHDKDELFIIDQHASDEKFNFERLQAETTVGHQRMVRPVTLDLTAVEEEIVLENGPALEKNGFIIEVDTSGLQPVGRRCTLLSLPLSKEVVFDTRDLDELLHLLSDAPMLGTESAVPRPSRVRKMFAMRACRSSIMIGKTLSRRQMRTVVSHMGTIDKPWNCPHGRPTMRHLTSLNALQTWDEGEGVMLDSESGSSHIAPDKWQAWGKYLASG